MLVNFLLTAILLFQIYSPTISVDKLNTTLESGHFSINQKDVIFPRQKLASQSLGLKLNAWSAIVVDQTTGKILFEKNSQEKHSLASITKLMAMVVFLETQPDWSQVITMQAQDQAEGAAVFVNNGEELKVEDLFYSALVGSANNAVKALVRSTGLSSDEFVNRMNIKAKQLGLNQTHFSDPTGLNPSNQSTAYDIAVLTRYAFQQPKILQAVLLDKYSFRTVDQNVLHTIKNTDELIDSFLNDGQNFKLIGGKTGFLNEAGYCLTTQVQDHSGHDLIIVLLGNRSSAERFREMKGLAWWTFENFEWE
ncbi:MAG: serine hydrolase [Patescibacteria group bacterium]|jgi:D-alanyl-D-alanine carboxypeptidase|nr:serine hydrolase [Patescibacteria group bacterium]